MGQSSGVTVVICDLGWCVWVCLLQVFGIVSVQLLFTVGIACIFLFNTTLKVRRHPWVFVAGSSLSNHLPGRPACPAAHRYSRSACVMHDAVITAVCLSSAALNHPCSDLRHHSHIATLRLHT
jgi:hypothetical protein